MHDSSHMRVPREVQERFLALVKGCLESLQAIKTGISLRDELAYALQLTAEPGNMIVIPLVQKLHVDVRFLDLVRFVWDQSCLCAAFICSSQTDVSYAHPTDPVYGSYLELTLLRIICTLDIGSGTRNMQELLTDLVAFLNVPAVRRSVVVPLGNLKCVPEMCSVDEFGILRNAPVPPAEDNIPERVRSGIPAAQLEFWIKSGHFTAAHLFPLSDEIRLRVAVLRLVVGPLISYNHFSVEHRKPWETPLKDSTFFARFWGNRRSRPAIPSAQFEDRQAIDIAALAARFHDLDWGIFSPWRLAIDRLDDAVFKLECGSPDAILDLVIGLESLFVEPDSRQESTHKVATRVARYLETGEDARKETFRLVKKLYQARSTLAHGQAWKLDQSGQRQLESAALILSRSLRKMAEEGRTRIDHLAIDLS